MPNYTYYPARSTPLGFSSWPIGPGRRQQSVIFTQSPWRLLENYLRKSSNLSTRVAKASALSYLEQAEAFFNAYITTSSVNSKPLLLYYSFLNLGKCRLLETGVHSDLSKAHHGLKHSHLGGLYKDLLEVKSFGNMVPIFNELARLYNGRPYPPLHAIRPIELLSQVVTCHRLWSLQTKGRERFSSVYDITYCYDRVSKEVTIRLFLDKNEVRRFAMTDSRLLFSSQMNRQWKIVNEPPPHGYPSGSSTLCFEFRDSCRYTSSPAEVLNDISQKACQRIYTIANQQPPYFNYYIYINAERRQRAQQLIVIYALAFYFGSMVRYTPDKFEAALNQKFGAVLQEFILSAGPQFLYLIASDILKIPLAKSGASHY